IELGLFALTHLTRARLLLLNGRSEDAVRECKRAVTIAEALPDERQLIDALSGLGFAYVLRADATLALPPLERALARCRRIGDRSREGRTLRYLGGAAIVEGRVKEAASSFLAARSLSRATGDVPGEADALTDLASAEALLGRRANALEQGAEAM